MSWYKDTAVDFAYTYKDIENPIDIDIIENDVTIYFLNHRVFYEAGQFYEAVNKDVKSLSKYLVTLRGKFIKTKLLHPDYAMFELVNGDTISINKYLIFSIDGVLLPSFVTWTLILYSECIETKEITLDQFIINKTGGKYDLQKLLSDYIENHQDNSRSD
ncbi:MAG: hypothetical protein B6U94_06560 [Thermofilum sp. ex4484_79]|nr:MAG: hypothetical protein B6U94_06560 [Thermofilum sp. ex4484_79]